MYQTSPDRTRRPPTPRGTARREAILRAAVAPDRRAGAGRPHPPRRRRTRGRLAVGDHLLVLVQGGDLPRGGGAGGRRGGGAPRAASCSTCAPRTSTPAAWARELSAALAADVAGESGPPGGDVRVRARGLAPAGRCVTRSRAGRRRICGSPRPGCARSGRPTRDRRAHRRGRRVGPDAGPAREPEPGVRARRDAPDARAAVHRGSSPSSRLTPRLDAVRRRGVVGGRARSPSSAMNSSSASRARRRTVERSIGVQPSRRPGGPSAWRAQRWNPNESTCSAIAPSAKRNVAAHVVHDRPPGLAVRVGRAPVRRPALAVGLVLEQLDLEVLGPAGQHAPHRPRLGAAQVGEHRVGERHAGRVAGRHPGAVARRERAVEALQQLFVRSRHRGAGYGGGVVASIDFRNATTRARSRALPSLSGCLPFAVRCFTLPTTQSSVSQAPLW